jgi:hypothetical protein
MIQPVLTKNNFMKLYVLEYDLGVGVGSIVALSKNIKSLSYLIKDEKIIKNKVDIELYNTFRNLHNISKDELKTIIEALSKKAASRIEDLKLKRATIFEGDNIEACNILYSLSLSDGLYIVAEIETMETEEKIISDTYYKL